MKKYLKAGIATYVMMMIGFSIMFYLFGFHSMWTEYSGQPALNMSDVNLTKADVINPNSMYNMQDLILGVIGVFVAGSIITFIVGKFVGVNSTILTLIFPILLLFAFMNLFFFPVLPGAEGHMNDYFPLTAFLLLFFNAWFILSIIEFVRSG